MSIRKKNKLLLALEDYLESTTADPITLAAAWTTLPDEVQQVLWETVINYIQETASRTHCNTGLMSVYRDQARDLRDHL